MAINKLPSGSYQVKVRGTDGRWITKSFDSQREALTFEAQLKAMKSSGSPLAGTSARITLDEYFVQWFQVASTSGAGGWRKRQLVMYKMYVHPILGNSKLSEVRPPMVAKVLAEMAKLGKAESTRTHVYMLLKKMFGDAIAVFQILQTSPVLRTLKPRIPQKEARFLTMAESQKLLSYSTGKPYEVAVALGLFVGLRIGEIQALRWEDVNLESGFIQVRRSYCKSERVFRDYPKGKKQHIRRIPVELQIILEQALPSISCGADLVAKPVNWAMLDYWHFRRALRSYCREAEVPEISAHGLRHSTSELYLSHGATIEDLRTLFAHASSSTTFRYVHGKGTSLEKIANAVRLLPDKCSTNVPREALLVRCGKDSNGVN